MFVDGIICTVMSDEFHDHRTEKKLFIVYVLSKSSKAVINFCQASWLHFAFFFVIIEDIHRNVKRIE